MDDRLRTYTDAGWTIQSQGPAGIVLVAPRVVPRRLVAALVITPLVLAAFVAFLTLTPLALLLCAVATIGGLVSLAVYLLRPRRTVIIPPA